MKRALEGKRALVTGATGYLGREISKALALAGANVLINGRSVEKCAAFVSELHGIGLNAELAAFDIVASNAVEQYFNGLDQAAPLHILVNNAHSGRGGTIRTATSTDFLEAYDVNVVAAHRLMQKALTHMQRAVEESGDASIVNIISMYGLVSPDPRRYDSPETTNPPYYGAAKAGLAQLTRYAASELGPIGIRCNGVAPGPFPSHDAQCNSPALMEKLRQRVPLGRLGSPIEIGPPVLFLASPAASFITGAILPVDGGWTVW